MIDAADSGIQLPPLPDTLTSAQMDEITSSDSTIEVNLPLGELNEAVLDAGLDLDLSETAEPETLVEDGYESLLVVTGAGYNFGGSAQNERSMGGSSVFTSRAGDRCNLVPGIMWSRSSGRGYPYGTVGSKPKLTNCTSGVRRTGLHSDVYRFNGWGWDKVAGTFNSYGTSNMEQKSVQYVCKNRSWQKFQVITTGWGTNSRGQTGVGRDSTAVTRLQCG